MTVRAWSRLFWQSFGAAAVVAAAQWGLGYGLGLIDWGQPFEAGNENAWNSLLTWTAFISAVSVLGGAAVGGPGIRRPNHRVKLNARFTAAIAAGLGTAAALPVAWLPARVAQPPISEGFTVTIAAAEGIVVGIVLAALAMTLATAATSLVATVAWAWSVALACCGVAIAQGEPTNHVRLGVIDAGSLIPPNAWWFGPELMIGLAVLIGAATATVARRRGAPWLGIVASGLAGPALIAAAYGIGGPGVSGDHRDQFQPYLAALLGAGAALLAASLVVMLRPRRRASSPAAVDSSAEVGSDSTGSGSARKAATGKRAGGKGAPVKAEAAKATPVKAEAAKAGAETAMDDATEPAPTGKRGRAPARSAAPKTVPAVPARKPTQVVTTTLSVDDLEVAAKPVKKTRATRAPAASAPAASSPATPTRSATETDLSELDLPAARVAPAPPEPPAPPAPSATPSAPARKSSARSTRGRSGKSAQAAEATPSAASSAPVAPPPASPPARPLSKRAARKEEAARREAERKAEAARQLAARREAAQEAARQEAARKAAAKARRKAPAKRGAVANARRDRLRRSDLDHIDWVRELVHGSDEPEHATQPDR